MFVIADVLSVSDIQQYFTSTATHRVGIVLRKFVLLYSGLLDTFFHEGMKDSIDCVQ